MTNFPQYSRAEILANLYPNFLKLGTDGILEMYCDNHMLSSFRKCQGYFKESFLSSPGYTLTPKKREWSLTFGAYVHKCMEYFNLGQRDNWEGRFHYKGKDELVSLKQDYGNFLQICMYFWKKYNLEDFKDTKQYKALGGMAGAVLLFTHYFKVHYHAERLRYIAWEVTFGRNQEVPIVTSPSWPFRAYLTGRIDNIVDTGTVIGPLDIKTKAFFDGTEGNDFKPHDGMEGYVYAWQQMVPEEVKKIGRMCNSMIISHISIQAPANMHERFKRSEKPYTPAELEEWRHRQIATFEGIYDVLNGRTPTWNTELCSMWYYKRDCPFKDLHEVPPSYRDNLVKLNYQTKEAWSEQRNGE